MKEDIYFRAKNLKDKIDYYKEQLGIWKDATDATMPKICLDGITVSIENFLTFGELRNMAIIKYKAMLEKYKTEFDNL